MRCGRPRDTGCAVNTGMDLATPFYLFGWLMEQKCNVQETFFWRYQIMDIKHLA